MIYYVFFLISIIAMITIPKIKFMNDGKSFTIRLSEYITLFLFTLLTASRSTSVGTDTLNYYYSASNIDFSASFLTLFTNYYLEPGYGLLEIISVKYLGDYHFIFLFESLVLLVGLFSFIHNYENNISIPIAFVVFFSFYYCPSLNISRQYIAVGIGLLASKYIFEERPVKYFSLCIIATLFHISGLMLFVSYFINKIVITPRSEKKYLVRSSVISVLVFIICVFINPITSFFVRLGIVPAKYLDHLHYSEATSSLLMVVLANLPILVLIVLFYKDLLKLNFNNRTIIVYYLLGFFVTLLNTRFGNVGRLAVYWSIWQIILYPECLEIILKKYAKSMSVIVQFGFVLLFSLYWYYCYVFRGFANVVPYSSDVFAFLNW